MSRSKELCVGRINTVLYQWAISATIFKYRMKLPTPNLKCIFFFFNWVDSPKKNDSLPFLFLKLPKIHILATKPSDGLKIYDLSALRKEGNSRTSSSNTVDGCRTKYQLMTWENVSHWQSTLAYFKQPCTCCSLQLTTRLSFKCSSIR